MQSPKSIARVQSAQNRDLNSQILTPAPFSVAETLREVSKHRLLKNHRLVHSQVPTGDPARFPDPPKPVKALVNLSILGIFKRNYSVISDSRQPSSFL